MESEARPGRRTPFELVFEVDGLAEREFPELREEAERRGVETARRHEFARLERARALLGQLAPDPVDPVALDRYLDVLFHAFNFWSAGHPLFACDAEPVRDLVETGPDLGGWRPRLPHPALYLELPKNLFWAEAMEDQPPEPVEGVFVTREPVEGTRAELLLVMGMRPERPGLSAAGLTVDLEQTLEPSGPDLFRSSIPGAELAGLYSLSRSSEAVLLLLRLLWYIDTYPDSLERVPGADTAEPRASGQPMPTVLDHYRVRRVERSRG